MKKNSPFSYNKTMITKSLVGNVIKILKTRNTPSVMDILYLKKVKAVLESVSILKLEQAFRVRELCKIEITPQMCMDEVNRLNMFVPSSPSFYDQCLQLKNPKPYVVPRYSINAFALFLDEWKPLSSEDDLIIYNRFEQVEFGEKDLTVREFLNEPWYDTDNNTFTLYSLLDAPKEVLVIKYEMGEILAKDMKIYSSWSYNKTMKTKSLVGNVIKILKTRNTPSVMDILYLKKVKAVLESVSILKLEQAFRVRELCKIEITPQMCMDEVNRLNMFVPSSPSFYDQCLQLKNPKPYVVPRYSINAFALFLDEWKPLSSEDDLIIYNRFEQVEFGEKDLTVREFLNEPWYDTDNNTFTLYSLLDAPKDVLVIKYEMGKIKARLLRK